MALPNSGMDAVPFTPLTAEFLDDIIENIEHIDNTGGRQDAIRTYTSNATWYKPAGLKYIEVEVVGGGGAGGSAPSTSGSQRGGGGGGGGGGYAMSKIDAATLSATEDVTVGAGGTPGASGSNPGGTGGNSSFDLHLSGLGGGGGAAGLVTGLGGAGESSGGTGGAAIGGDLNIQGGTGVSTCSYDARTMSRGNGGVSAKYGTSALAIDGGTAGYGYGGGGGGSVVGVGTAATQGGAGAPGVVIVREYF